jgi:hypothetical protein
MNAVTGWMPEQPIRESKPRRARHLVFVLDPENPDVVQARQSAYEWHGRLWSPLLYCYASLGCKIANDEFRQALINEIELALGAVEANAQCYEQDEPAKLRNLKKCVEARKPIGPESRRKKGGTPGLSRLSLCLIRLKKKNREEETNGK